MHPAKLTLLTALTLCLFAANSLLCRMALRESELDAASFTLLRLGSGALMLACIVRLRPTSLTSPVSRATQHPFAMPATLLGYAVFFSFAYLTLSAGTGALLLFGAVQLTMFIAAWMRGDRLRGLQWAGFGMAASGLVWVVLPGVSAPSLAGAMLMILAGICWGAYSLLGRGAIDPIGLTARNFSRAALLSLPLLFVATWSQPWDWRGIACAVVSGTIASGAGYSIWYTVLRHLQSTTAACLQLSVPVLAAVGGALLLAELPSWRVVGSAVLVLGGIVLVVLKRPV